MNLDNTKIYTTDPEVIRKYAVLCGKELELDHEQYNGIGYDSTDRTINSFTDISQIHKGVLTSGTIMKEITTDQVNALYDEKFGNHSEAPNSSEWKNGDMCDYKNEDDKWESGGRYVCFDLFAGHHVFYANNMTLYHAAGEQIRKPETPEQREGRERLDSVYSLYCLYCSKVGSVPFPIAKFKEYKEFEFFESLVDETGYHKQKDGE